MSSESFEFPQEYNPIFIRFANLGIAIGIVVIIYTIVAFFANITDPSLSSGAIWLVLAAIFQITIGVFFILPSRDFKDVATTEGEDVDHLMDGMDKLANSFKYIVLLVIGSILANIGLGIQLGGA